MSQDNNIISLPEKLREALYNNNKVKSDEFAIKVLNAVMPFSKILEENRLTFFPEYTDHGKNHINSILECVEQIASDDSIKLLSSEEVGVLILSVALHDIGMQVNEEMFKNMLNGKYDNLRYNDFNDTKTWADLWAEYLNDYNYWSDKKRRDVLGDDFKTYIHQDINDHLKKKDGLTGSDKKLIGEFIRKHHCRIAYEVAIAGYMGSEKVVKMKCEHPLDQHHIRMAGIIARSHGMSLRDVNKKVLPKIYGRNWKQPNKIHIVYLMVLLRLADYLQIDNGRINETTMSLHDFVSGVSEGEQKTHLAILDLQYGPNDPAEIYIEADADTHKEENNINAQMHVKIERLVEDIQREFDLSWAILGDVYLGSNNQLSYRRVSTNLTDDDVRENLDYIPRQFTFRFNDNLSKQLIGPLYDYNPSYAVRELVQNAVDACREREARDKKYSYRKFKPNVRVTVDEKKRKDGKEEYLFTIMDNGKGMTLDEIEKYFLTIGSSYNSSTDWQRFHDKNNVYRTGRFGIGVLAAFLLGLEIEVSTRSMNEKTGYTFKATLESSFIEIKKISKSKVGTTITIQCDKESYNQLKEEAEEEYKLQEHDYWYNWYINEYPIVEYYFNKEPLRVKEIESKQQYETLQHNCSNFGEVKWLPQLRSYLHTVPDLYCNGFYITDYPNKRFFAIKGLQKYFPEMHIPFLQIEDKNNSLPINLQRTNIDGNFTYDFEEELAKEAFTDFIQQMKIVNDVKVLSAYKIKQNFYFCPEGLALKCDYTDDHLIGRNLVSIDCSFTSFKKLINYIRTKEQIIVFRFVDLDVDDSIIEKVNYCFSFSLERGNSIRLRDDILKKVSNPDHIKNQEFHGLEMYYDQEEKKVLMETLITEIKELLGEDNLWFISIGEIKAPSREGMSDEEIEELQKAEAPFEEIARREYPNDGNPIIPYDNLLESLKNENEDDDW